MQKQKLEKAIGTKIRSVMKSKEIPALKLAALTDISQSTIYTIQAGRGISVYTLCRLAKGLNCEVSDLLPKMDEL